jgi:hypothetical protein
MEALIRKKTVGALGVFRFADRSSESDEVKVQGQGLALWDERNHPSMGLFCMDSFRDETEALSHPEDMRVNRKGFPSHAKEKETVDRFWTNPFEASKGLLNFFRTHLS